jgi:hypothetical protein
MTDDRLAELEALASAATPGPWRAGRPTFQCVLDHGKDGHGRGNCRYGFRGWVDGGTTVSRDVAYGPESVSTDEAPVVAGMWDYEEGGVREPADASFIAAARIAVPELIAEIRRLREAKP